MEEVIAKIFNPAVLIFLIPLAGIGLGAFKVWTNHQERMEKIRQGMDPDAAPTAKKGDQW